MMTKSLNVSSLFSIILITLFCTCSFINFYQIDSQSLNQNVTHNAKDSRFNFTAAGSEKISINGEPIHLGDNAYASLLINNKGNHTDSVRLVIEGTNNSIWYGKYVEIESGSSREINTIFLPSKIGNNEFNWSVESPNGGIDVELIGTFSVEVRSIQSLHIDFNSYSWTPSEGLEVISSVYLSEGVSREIIIILSDHSDGEKVFLQSLKLTLDHGMRTIIFNLGHPNVESLFIEAIPLSWILNSSDSRNTSTSTVTPPLILLDVEFDNIYPMSPIKNENISFVYTVTNNGNSKSSPGLIRLIMPDQTIIQEGNLPSLSPEATYSDTIIIYEWPYAQPTNVSIYIFSDDYYSSNWILIDSSNPTESSQLPFDIYAVSYGSVAGLTIVLLSKVVISAISNRTPSTKKPSKLRKPRVSRVDIINKEKQEKREVSCPLCEQRLNVPSLHKGLVKCPSCESNFEVLPEMEVEDKSINISKVDINSTNDTDQSGILSSSSKGDMLNCPSCEQKLRVLESKRPVRARCPACRCEFMALSEEK